MSSCTQIENQDVKITDGEDSLEDISNESRELFKRAIFDAMDLEIRKIEEEIKDVEIPPPSKRHKIRMNRLFRECVGGSFLPFPEADNLYERLRSRLVRKLKLNEIFYCRKNADKK